MPIARKYSLQEVLSACDTYFRRTGRRISYEYSLVRGVNDTPEKARALGKLLGGRACHVNLIPVNPVKERGFLSSSREAVQAFQSILEQHGVTATVRREMGRDINGACGQLRRSYLKEQEG